MVGVIIPVEEEHVPKACTQESGKTAVNAQIDKMFFCSAAILFGQKITNTGG
jgi:hypothetical protein